MLLSGLPTQLPLTQCVRISTRLMHNACQQQPLVLHPQIADHKRAVDKMLEEKRAAYEAARAAEEQEEAARCAPKPSSKPAALVEPQALLWLVFLLKEACSGHAQYCQKLMCTPRNHVVVMASKPPTTASLSRAGWLAGKVWLCDTGQLQQRWVEEAPHNENVCHRTLHMHGHMPKQYTTASFTTT